uniref:Putative secreted peptide n=1 Tax=Anopheles braziliensis TaxID=58242 RepID=A0A2M3ZTZ6_9DIPT
MLQHTVALWLALVGSINLSIKCFHHNFLFHPRNPAHTRNRPSGDRFVWAPCTKHEHELLRLPGTQTHSQPHRIESEQASTSEEAMCSYGGCYTLVRWCFFPPGDCDFRPFPCCCSF